MYTSNNHLGQWFKPRDWWIDLVDHTRIRKPFISAFIWGTGHLNCPLWWWVPSWSLDLISYALFWPSASQIMFEEAVFRRQYSSASVDWGHFWEPKTTELNCQSNARPVGHLGRSVVHFLSSIAWCRQPWCCSRSELNEQGIYIIKT